MFWDAPTGSLPPVPWRTFFARAVHAGTIVAQSLISDQPTQPAHTVSRPARTLDAALHGWVGPT